MWACWNMNNVVMLCLCLLYLLWCDFKRYVFISKTITVIVNKRLSKMPFYEKTNEYCTAETLVIYCWGCELIHSLVRMWLTPQLYRYWSCFCYRFSLCKRWPRNSVFEILQLRHIVGVVAAWTWRLTLVVFCCWLVSYVPFVFCRAYLLVCN